VKEKVAAPVYRIEITAIGIRRTDYVPPPLFAEVGTNFSDKRRSLGQYSSLATKATELLLHSYLFSFHYIFHHTAMVPTAETLLPLLCCYPQSKLYVLRCNKETTEQIKL
jgi:hypothetical protein